MSATSPPTAPATAGTAPSTFLTGADGAAAAADAPVHVRDVLGALWYTLHQQRAAERAPGISTRRAREAAREGELYDAALAKEDREDKTESFGASTTPDKGSDSERSRTSVEDVDWMLLAAHFYALTGTLHSSRALRRVVVDEILGVAFKGDVVAMRAAYAAQLTALVAHEAVEAERQRVVASASPAPAGTGPSGVEARTGARLQVKIGAGLPPTPPATARLAQEQAVGAHIARPPVTANISAPAESLPWHQAGSGGGGDAAVQQTVSASVPPGATAASAHSTATSAQPQPPPSHAGGGPAGGGESGAAREAHRAALAQVGPPAMHGASMSLAPPLTPRAASTFAHTSLEPEAASGAAPPVLPHATPLLASGPGCTTTAAAPPTAAFEPDPLDAPWCALWSSLPTPHARAQLHRLRYATPLPLEDFSSLLEQFYLVDGADDFLVPVHAATIMEFAGVRSGPYQTIVCAPLSLSEVRRYITETHRQYARAAVSAAAAAELAAHGDAGTDVAHTSSNARASEGLAASAAHSPRGIAEVRHTRRGAAAGNTGTAADVQVLLDCHASGERRVLTLAELERSVWHIAANCACFNAPESRYPRTAHHFATGCMTVMMRYCEKQLAAYLTVQARQHC